MGIELLKATSSGQLARVWEMAFRGMPILAPRRALWTQAAA